MADDPLVAFLSVVGQDCPVETAVQLFDAADGVVERAINFFYSNVESGIDVVVVSQPPGPADVERRARAGPERGRGEASTSGTGAGERQRDGAVGPVELLLDSFPIGECVCPFVVTTV